MNIRFLFLLLAAMPYLADAQSVTSNTPGQLDPSWVLTSPTFASAPSKLRARNDGVVYVAGLGPGLYRIGADGVADATWNMGTGANNTVRDMIELPDGKVMIAGRFTSVSGLASRYLARLNSNGSVDTGFNMGTAINGAVSAIHRQGDGKFLIAGEFTLVHGASRVGIARLNADFSLDTSFNPGTGAPNIFGQGAVGRIYPVPGGKYIIAGSFNNYNGSGKGSLVRIHNDGSFDTSWVLENTFMSGPVDLVLQPDGKMLLAYFGDAKMVRRLFADGSVDPSFETTMINGSVYGMSLQADGKVVIAGEFNSINSVNRNRFARLNSDGTLDTEFFNSGGVSGNINAMAILPNGDMIIAGNFTSVQGQARTRIAKIFGAEPAVVSVERGTESLPQGIELLGNYPNPFNPGTVIRFQISGDHMGSPVRLGIYDILGREVAVLVDGILAAGEHQARFDASDLASGVYLVRLESAGIVRTSRMTLLK